MASDRISDDDHLFHRNLRFWNSLSHDLGMLASDRLEPPSPPVPDDTAEIHAYVGRIIAGTLRPRRPPPPPFTTTEGRALRARLAFFFQTVHQLASGHHDVDQLLAAYQTGLNGDDARERAGLNPASHRAALTLLRVLVDTWPGIKVNP